MTVVRKSQYLFVLTFAVLVLFGTCLLSLPGSTHGVLPFIDSLFTATSAVCVTGLNSVDISTFTFQGRIILLVLMQLGGLGIMSLSTACLLLVKHHIDVEERLIMSNINEPVLLKELEGILRTSTKYVFYMEAIGFCLLFPGFLSQEKGDWSAAAFNALFHSVSAFCNAGFSTYSDSLVGCNVWIQFIVSLLIVCGGLGFYVVYDLVQFRQKRHRLRGHSKIVLGTTILLVVGGALMIKGIQVEKVGWFDAYFQSVTTRTAGFNTVDLTTLHSSCVLTMIILMIIGASPMSTGGGIKTTAFFIIVYYIFKSCQGGKQTLVFGRAIPMGNIMKAFTLASFYMLLILVFTQILLLLGDYSIKDAMFETVSALGTVGLSLGVSMSAGVKAKILLILCMFMGRIGPLSFLIFLISREKKSMLMYPEERIILG